MDKKEIIKNHGFKVETEKGLFEYVVKIKDLNQLINSTREECAKIVEESTLISDSLLSRHKVVKELQFEIAKAIRDSKPQKKRGGCNKFC